MRNENTRGRNASEPLLAHSRARLAPQAPVFESSRARGAHEPKNRAWQVTYISNQIFLTHTSNNTYEDRVQGSLNKILPTVRLI